MKKISFFDQVRRHNKIVDANLLTHTGYHIFTPEEFKAQFCAEQRIAARMSQPQRIQLSRKAGFNLQLASQRLNGLPAVKVDRSTKWGNPFPIGVIDSRTGEPVTASQAVESFRRQANGRSAQARRFRFMVREELKGKNLACWCKRGRPCHASVLLKIANS